MLLVEPQMFFCVSSKAGAPGLPLVTAEASFASAELRQKVAVVWALVPVNPAKQGCELTPVVPTPPMLTLILLACKFGREALGGPSALPGRVAALQQAVAQGDEAAVQELPENFTGGARRQQLDRAGRGGLTAAAPGTVPSKRGNSGAPGRLSGQRSYHPGSAGGRLQPRLRGRSWEHAAALCCRVWA